MLDDFEKGRRGESANVSNQDEYARGVAFQRALNPPPSFAPRDGGPVITGESALLQGIVSIPFVILGALLYPVTAIATLIAGLLCVRLIPLFGSDAGLVRYIAFVPALLVFWFAMRWDQRMGERNTSYRRVRHVARLLVFAFVAAVVVGLVWRTGNGSAGQLLTLPHLVGVGAGALLGHLFLMRADGWHDFWYRTLARFRLRPTR